MTVGVGEETLAYIQAFHIEQYHMHSFFPGFREVFTHIYEDVYSDKSILSEPPPGITILFWYVPPRRWWMRGFDTFQSCESKRVGKILIKHLSARKLYCLAKVKIFHLQ